MTEAPATEHVTTVALGAALAAFADGEGTRDGAAAEGVAARAADWLTGRFGRHFPVLYARQEHTRITYVYSVEAPLPPGPHLVGTCDALITDARDVALLVRTADCLPVALAGGGVVAMVHAGWRGLAADILGATVKRVATDFGIAAADLAAAIGVGIGPCHYQVGPEVVEGLRRLDTAAAAWRHGDAVDLAAYARSRLVALGLEMERIAVLPGCTSCLPSFYSYRRDGQASGRQWSLVLFEEGGRQ